VHTRNIARILIMASAAGLCALSTASGRELTVPQVQVDRLNIQLEELRIASNESAAVLPATIVPPLNSRHAVPAPFAGTVVGVVALPGQAVSKGAPLVTLASRDLVDMLVKLRQAEADLQAAKAIAQRYQALGDKDIVAANRVAETAAQAARIETLVRETKALLAIGNIQLNADRTYTLTAPRDGRIVETRAAPGSALQAMDTAIVVDTGEGLWAQAQVPANLIQAIRVGDEVETANGAKGRVISVGIALDPLTRSVPMIAELPAAAALLSGQMTTLTVRRAFIGAGLEAPADAVAWIDGIPRVFARTNTGFNLVSVKLRGQGSRLVTLEGDLQPGQRVAASGLAQLEQMTRGE
jgi:cobalt-zinc-cadmium efflux system membrane fusion protein